MQNGGKKFEKSFGFSNKEMEYSRAGVESLFELET